MSTLKILNSQKFATNGQLIDTLIACGTAEEFNSAREVSKKVINPDFAANKLDGRKTYGYANGKYIPKYLTETKSFHLTRCEESFGKGAIAVFVSYNDNSEDMLDGDSARDEAYAEMDAKRGSGDN